MCEVTRRNFEETLFPFCRDLRSASFISIDCEFSGIYEDIVKCTLFDSPEERFRKLQKALADFIIIQFGVSAFKYESSSDTYTASTYNFYLRPPAGLGTHAFAFHPGSVEFLCKNNFDFNKLFYDGINYVELYREGMVKAKVEDGSLINKDISESIQKYCSEVSEWLQRAKTESEMYLKLNDRESTFLLNLLHQEIRKRFHNAWTYFEEGRVKIRKITSSEKMLLQSSIGEDEVLKTEIFFSLIGFSSVVKLIEESGKPVVGHNILLDLIMIYKQFINPWPVSYKQFKTTISHAFPVLFDTKHISFTLREFLSKKNTWNSNSLSDLYEYLKRGKGAKLVIFSPVIRHTNEDFVNQTHFHHAGFDSYCTGFCFLKLAHLLSLKGQSTKSDFRLTTMKTTWTWLLGAVAPMVNRANMSRGQVDYIVLGGKDPKSSRPGLLYLESKTKCYLNISKVSERIAKYASVDIRPLTKYSALMAVSNHKQYREILERFKGDREVRVTKYSFLRHSETGKAVRVALVASIILSAVFLTRRFWASGPISGHNTFTTVHLIRTHFNNLFDYP